MRLLTSKWSFDLICQSLLPDAPRKREDEEVDDLIVMISIHSPHFPANPFKYSQFSLNNNLKILFYFFKSQKRQDELAKTVRRQQSLIERQADALQQVGVRAVQAEQEVSLEGVSHLFSNMGTLDYDIHLFAHIINHADSGCLLDSRARSAARKTQQTRT